MLLFIAGLFVVLQNDVFNGFFIFQDFFTNNHYVKKQSKQIVTMTILMVLK